MSVETQTRAGHGPDGVEGGAFDIKSDAMKKGRGLINDTPATRRILLSLSAIFSLSPTHGNTSLSLSLL